MNVLQRIGLFMTNKASIVDVEYFLSENHKTYQELHT